ncbi:MAG: hypothetical protein FWG46_08940 [Treponema sp.]|nr:hypothetical protein [Treponema sp.]
MFPKDFMGLLVEIVKSWQVVAVTVALVLYIFLVNYVARTYHRPRFVSKNKPKKTKGKAAPKPQAESVEEDSNEALGLEES